MNDHSNDQWERPRHHHGEGKRKPRVGPRGYPGYDPADDEADFGRGRGYRGGPPGYGEFGGPGFARRFPAPEYGGGDFGPGFGGPGPGFGGPGPGFGGPGPGFRPGPGFHRHPGHGPWSRSYGRRGGRARRGDVRAAALALIAEQPMNGYQIIQEIAERSGGLWRPSPGSVYPALAQLEDEGLIAQREAEGSRRAYALTEAGSTYVAEHADELREPWSAMAGDAATALMDMKMLVRQVHLAAGQVASAGTDAQLAQARTVLTKARRALYRILAEDDDDTAGSDDTAAADDADRDATSDDN